MPTYVVLYRFTDQGRQKIKATVARAERIRQENEARGFRVIGSWWTQGQYDLVTAIEAPSEEAMLQGLFNIAEVGNVTSETLRAYTQTEMRRALRGAARRPARRRRAAPRRAAAARAPARRAVARKAPARRPPAARRAPARRAPARRAPARRRGARR
jgi:uncharacterized protein with GYD domain